MLYLNDDENHFVGSFLTMNIWKWTSFINQPRNVPHFTSHVSWLHNSIIANWKARYLATIVVENLSQSITVGRTCSIDWQRSSIVRTCPLFSLCIRWPYAWLTDRTSIEADTVRYSYWHGQTCGVCRQNMSIYSFEHDFHSVRLDLSLMSLFTMVSKHRPFV
jgi:hypothetical protein